MVRMEARRFVRLALPALGTWVLYMTQTGPDEAVVNFCKWPRKHWPSLPEDCLHGLPGPGLYLIAAFLIVGGVVWFFWPQLKHLGSRYMSMRDAAQLVYDKTRHTIIAGIARHDPDDDPLLATATLLIVSPNIIVRGKVRGATVSDEIDHEVRKNMAARADLETIGYGGERDPRFYQIEISRARLGSYIKNQCKMSDMFLSK